MTGKYWTLALTVAFSMAMGLNAVAQDEPTPADDPLPKAQASKDDAPRKLSEAAKPLAVTVEILDGMAINGTLVDLVEMPLRTVFGEAKVPLSEVAGIKMAGEGAATTTLVLHNGDSVTGATNLSEVTVQTDWGKAVINGPNVASILFAQGVEWKSGKGFSGSRWTLAEKSSTQSATTSSSVRPANATTTRSTRPAPSNVIRSGGFPPFR